MTIRAIVFDAYGTLFDVHSVARCGEGLFPGHGARLSQIWRERQIAYSRLRTLSGRYRPFSAITADALRYALKALKLEDDNGDAQRALMQAYLELDLFAENTVALDALARLGLPLGILSNGDLAMLLPVCAHAGVSARFAHIISVDAAQQFKTAPAAYALVDACFAFAPEQILFVSSNCWDVCGAAWYGFRTFWINRQGEPLEELDVRPDGSAATMEPLVAFATQLIA